MTWQFFFIVREDTEGVNSELVPELSLELDEEEEVKFNNETEERV